MKNWLKVLLLIAVCLLSPSVRLSAHHGNASYANDKKVTVTGVVTAWVWANPHCFLAIDAKDENGEVKHWRMEASNPPDMTRQGWANNSFKPGDEISATVIVAKNGVPIGRFVGKDNIILNGKPFPPSGDAQPEPKR